MNLHRPQKPYRFRPPRQAAWFRPILHLLTRIQLRWKYNVRHLELHGGDRLAGLVRDRHSVMITPNHADHADPGLLIEAGRRLGIAPHFMAAREGFEKGAVEEFILQRAGAFSVDREGADIAAVKTAIGLLRECRNPLVIFPEGEIYHHHEELDDFFNEGVASILLHASEKLPPGKSAFAIPTLIRIGHDPGVAATFGTRLEELERRLTLKPGPRMDIVDRIYRFGGAILALKEEEFMGRRQDGGLVERLAGLQRFIVEDAEKKFGLKPEGEIPARIKALRQSIRQKLHGKGAPQSSEITEGLYDDLDRIFVAQQLYSYPGRYLSEDPSTDRIAETIFKLEEDVLGVQRYPAQRHATLEFGEPVDARRFLRDAGFTAKNGVRPLTGHLRASIEGMLRRHCGA